MESVPSTRRLYQIEGDTLYAFDETGWNQTGAFSMSGGVTRAAISADGTRVCALGGGSSWQIISLDPATLAPTGTVWTASQAGAAFAPLSAISISNTGTLALTASLYHAPSLVGVLNMTTGVLTDTISVPNDTGSTGVEISPDGAWIIAGEALCSFNGSSLRIAGAVAPTAIFSNTAGSLVQIAGTHLQTTLCSTLQTTVDVALPTTPAPFSLTLDRASGLVSYLTTPFNELKIHDPQTGAVRDAIPFINGPMYFQDTCVFGTMVLGGGIRVHVN
jgi:hypothetical protein